MTVKQVFNTSADLDFPTVLPTLDLDFANSKTLDPRITFTRASGGSYVGADGLIKYAGVNEARFDHDPATGESLGLLIEGSSTNLVVNSQIISLGSGEGSTFENNVGISPDGTNTMALITENTSNGEHYHGDVALTPTLGSFYCWSAFVKAGPNLGVTKKILFRIAAGNIATALCTINGQFAGNVSFSPGSQGVSAGSQYYGNGIYRFWLVWRADSASTTVCRIQFWKNGVGSVYVGEENNFYLWGRQLEEGPFPTSYIPTTTSTRTRQPDQTQIVGKNFSDFYNLSEWTLTVATKRNYSGNFIFFPNLLRINDATSNNNIGFYGARGSIQFTNFGVISGGINYTPYVAANISTTSPFKMVQALKKNMSTFGVNGILTPTATSVEVPPRMTRMGIGWDFSGQYWGSPISRISYYPKVLPNSQLISLTI